MRLLLDKCVPYRTYLGLLAEGHEVNYVRMWERDPGDSEILRIAYERKLILITLDKDFGELAVSFGLPHCGIVLLRRLRIRDQASACAGTILEHREELRNGAIVTIEPGRVRCRLSTESNPD